MISLQTISPPMPPDPVFGVGTDAFLGLLRLIGDPDAAKERLAKIHDAVLEANELIRAANEAQQKSDAALAGHAERIRVERAAHDDAMKEAKAKHDAECNSAMAEVRLQRDRVSKLEAKAKADATAAADLKADLEQRLAKIKSAAA